jgi:L-ascorbate metabolism protein UlaG (beta-lactamase superfamily)
VFFLGDSGYWHGWRDVGSELGPWHATLIPIGAYEPRWFMRRSHMNPEEAVRTWQDLGGEGLFIGMHWGAFRLTDEPPLEPPVRTREAWRQAGLPADALALPGPGGTTRVALKG